MNTSFKIANKVEILFKNNEFLGASEIAKKLDISRTITHKVLKDLLKEKKIKKIGKAPKVKYKSLIFSGEKFLENSENIKQNYIPDFGTKDFLVNNFYKFSPTGEILIGFEGIRKWCKERNINLEEKIKNFIKVSKHIRSLQDSCGLLDATEIFGKHFEKVYLDKVYYADQYNWMEFGRGKLAEMTFYAKQSQNKKLIEEVNNYVFMKLECLILKSDFDAIAITPHSIERKNQLLLFLKDKLKDLGLPFVNIIKYYENGIAIPQKSLKTRAQRIENAKNTIFINDKKISKYKKVFLIDDFVGSGSTLNETAKKLKEKGVKEVVGFSYVGNLNLSYDVINEV